MKWLQFLWNEMVLGFRILLENKKAHGCVQSLLLNYNHNIPDQMNHSFLSFNTNVLWVHSLITNCTFSGKIHTFEALFNILYIHVNVLFVTHGC